MMEARGQVVAVAVVYRQSDDELRSFLQAVAGLSYEHVTLMLVNNETGRQLDELVPSNNHNRVLVINAGRNEGFAGAVNFGVARALETKASYVLMLNTDIRILAPDLIERLQAPFRQDPATGLASPIIVQHPNQARLWYAGATVSKHTWIVRHPGLGGLVPRAEEPFQTQAICGCCALVSTDVFRQVGPMDEGLFMYFEDTELSVRARNAGFRIYVVPPALIAHAKTGNSMSAVQTYYGGRNVLMLAKRYNRRRWLALAGQIAIAPSVLRRARGSGAKRAFLRGLAAGLRSPGSNEDGIE